MTSRELPVERFESTPIEGTNLVNLVLTYRHPDTGQEFREHYHRMRVEDHGPDADGMHRYTFTPEHHPDPDTLRRYFPEEDPR